MVRLSGPAATSIAAAILRLPHSLEPRVATVAELTDRDGQMIDEAVVTFFAAPKSYTAEDVVEVSCHGSPVVLRHCLERAMENGARLAEPGEFTLRAFLNGRLDLPRAEAVRDLIDSTTLYQARVAARQTKGSLSKRLAPLKAQLLELIALLEAGIDFAEDDVDVAPASEILRRLGPIRSGIEALAKSYRYGRLVREGFSLAIVGRPNAGKSSLFNRLLEQDRAIVTEIPGTTRDVLSETVEIGGIPVRVLDTAGIREASETVEKLGIERSFQAMADADLTVVVIDGASERTDEDSRLVDRAREQGAFLVAANKCDLPGFVAKNSEHSVSALTGAGIDELRAAILDHLAPERRDLETGFVTSLRHANLLRESLEMLERATTAAETGIPHEMLLLDLYCALQPIDAVTGATTADDILNRIFSTFCIGK